MKKNVGAYKAVQLKQQNTTPIRQREKQIVKPSCTGNSRKAFRENFTEEETMNRDETQVKKYRNTT